MKGDRGWSGLGWTRMSTWRWSIESVQSGQLEWVVNVPGWLFVRDCMVMRQMQVMRSLAFQKWVSSSHIASKRILMSMVWATCFSLGSSVQGYSGFEFARLEVCVDLLADSWGYWHRQTTCPCGKEYGELVTYGVYDGVISQVANHDSR